MPSRFDHFDDTPESDDSWKGQHDWAIPAAPRKRSVIDTGPARHTFRVLRENFRSPGGPRRVRCAATTSTTRSVPGRERGNAIT